MKQNLLIVTEHYPCGAQESFLENEILELKKIYNVFIVTTDTEQVMSQTLPRGVIFYRPAEPVSGLKRILLRLACRFSRGYQDEVAIAKKENRLTREYQNHLLNILVKSRALYNYIRSQELFEREEPLLIYSSNFNDYLYGLCCLKDYSDDIRVVARCHNANMFNPRTGKRRDTVNAVINRKIDRVFFASEHSRRQYIEQFTRTGDDLSRLEVMHMGVPGQDRPPLDPLPQFFLRIVTCSPIEKDKRLHLVVDALSKLKDGCVEWVHIGSGSLQKELSAYARSKLGDKKGVRFRFLGKLSHKELYQYYHDNYVDLFLSVSIAESVPTAMMEAMANHIFVAATNVDGVSAVVDNQNGMLLPPDITADQLGLALDSFCQISKEQFVEKGEIAYQSWKQNFDAERNCVLFADRLAELCNLTEEDTAVLRQQDAEAEQEQAAKVPARSPLIQMHSSAASAEPPLSFRETLQELRKSGEEPEEENAGEEESDSANLQDFWEENEKQPAFQNIQPGELKEELEDSAELLKQLEQMSKK